MDQALGSGNSIERGSNNGVMKPDRSLAGSVSLIPRKAKPPAEGGSVDTHLSESDGGGEERE